MGEIERKFLTDRVAFLKSTYFLGGLNEKACKSLVHQMKVVDKPFGEEIIGWDKPISHFYIIEEGEVVLQRPVNRSNHEETTLKRLASKSSEVKDNLASVEYRRAMIKYANISVKGRNECFGEEHLYINGNTRYRAIVSSSKCQLITVPFENLRFTLATYSMYADDIQAKILKKLVAFESLRTDIKVKGILGSRIKDDDAIEEAINFWQKIAKEAASVQRICSIKVEGLSSLEADLKRVTFPINPNRDSVSPNLLDKNKRREESRARAIIKSNSVQRRSDTKFRERVKVQGKIVVAANLLTQYSHLTKQCSRS